MSNRFNVDILTKIITSNFQQVLSLQKIRDWNLQEDNSFCFSLGTLGKFLKYRLKFQFGNPKVVNRKVFSKNFNKIQFIFLQKVLEVIKQDKLLLFFDESIFANHKRNFKCWHLKDQNQRIKTYGKIKTKKLLMVVSNMQIIHFKINNNTNSNEVVSFFKEVVNKIKANIFLKETWENGNIWILLDNAPYHKTKAVKDYCFENKLNLLYNCAYSPNYNMVEIVSFLKKGFCSKLFVNE